MHAIEIRLTGDGIKPGLIRSHDLAEVLAAVEDLVISETIKRNENIKREDIVVGLYEIGDASVGLRFKTSIASAVTAFTSMCLAVAAGDFAELAPQSSKPLQVLWGFSKRHGSAAEFKLVGESAPLVVIDADTKLPSPAKIRGATEILAKVLRVGGKIPKAMLELPNGSILYCQVAEALAKEIGHQLYARGRFIGDATWDAVSLDLEDFQVTGFEPFSSEDPLTALRNIGQLISSETLENLESLLNAERSEGGFVQ